MGNNNASPSRIFGTFFEELPEYIEYLTIGFSPTYAPLKKRWENNGLSADFIADYFRVFYVSKQETYLESVDELLVANLRDSVKYVANELLENAMKFQDESIPFRKNTACIALSLHTDKIIFSVKNSSTAQQAAIFQQYIEQLLACNPEELYVQTMRDSAKAENANHSGLGLLSMICDHAATLGWKFQPHATDPNIVTVTTMVTLDADQP
ncbi:DUF6272 family protein [Beggiatoa leptomitoformis]|uniref:ATP-binding protein n=1 Tax=Beggiatoa leptomitoformis TaxID=288004 RepID=A0A2N9YIE5_9GAMM|nr:DUF6272 family protein [Beggiatoa leptomitoformis]ALG67532.1 ATP-binding protein [Beggiatoa leptomitoformis]AUI70243.1 ATP-binding protein [Beggiatoa leptomitoformis]